MDWQQVNVYAASEDYDKVTGILMSCGINSVELVDPIEEIKGFFDGEQTQARWDYIDYSELETAAGRPCVRFYVAADDSAREQLGSALERLDAQGFEYGMRVVKDEDWANNWKQYFPPIEIGEKVLILPSWLEQPHTDRLIYIMDNCALFGTGQHASTSFCIQQLEKKLIKGQSVLDIGAGSGILSIIAMMLGAGNATAVEIEPHAKEVILENAARNGIDKNYNVLVGDAVADLSLQEEMGKEFDIVLANIVADVIIKLLPLVYAKLKRGGTFISSGIIDERAEEVISAFKASGLTGIECLSKDGWCCVTAKKA